MPINCPETRCQCDRECEEECKLRKQQREEAQQCKLEEEVVE